MKKLELIGEVKLDHLATFHAQTYDALATDYEARVEALRPVTTYALSMLTKELQPGDRILDVGCAVGYTLEILEEQGMRPEGIDISENMIERARLRNPGLDIRCEDFFEAKYDSQSYHAVLMYAFIHLFPKTVALVGLAKAAHILKPGGHAFLSTTLSNIPSEGFETKADYDSAPKRFRKRWTREEFEQAISETGFEVVRNEDLTDEFGKVWMDYVVRKQ